MYGDGLGGAGSDLAVFPAADYTPSNHSHFESADIWFGGSIDQVQTGWLGRWLDTYGSQANPLQAVSIDNSLSKQIRTSTAPVCALQNLRGARFDLPGVDRQTIDPTQVMQTLAGVPAGVGNDAPRHDRGAPTASTVDMANRLATLTNTAAGAGYPANSQPLVAAADGGGPARRRPRHARRDDRLGRLRHARRPARLAGSRSSRTCRARSPRSRPT